MTTFQKVLLEVLELIEDNCNNITRFCGDLPRLYQKDSNKIETFLRKKKIIYSVHFNKIKINFSALYTAKEKLKFEILQESLNRWNMLVAIFTGALLLTTVILGTLNYSLSKRILVPQPNSKTNVPRLSHRSLWLTSQQAAGHYASVNSTSFNCSSFRPCFLM